MTLYAKYLTERTNDRILEMDHAFATYRIIPEQKAVYIIDIFVEPDFRKSKLASLMADKIGEIAKKEDCVKMIGSVVPSMKGGTDSIRVLLAYGMKIQSSTNDFILFEKEL